MGHGGEIFVLDMGEPVKIAYLAEQMIKLSGQVPGKDIRIVYTGLRPGEKLHEELFHKNENLEGTAHESILLARHRAEDPVHLDKHLDALKTACEEFDEESIDMCLQQLIPELQRHRKSTARVVALNPHGRREA
jgi:FlaA1/EpsC-like NDP-sugar epimerase